MLEPPAKSRKSWRSCHGSSWAAEVYARSAAITSRSRDICVCCGGSVSVSFDCGIRGNCATGTFGAPTIRHNVRSADATATIARQLSVNETAHLTLISHHTGLLIEEGNSSGTPGGRLGIRVNVSYEHTTRAAISFTAHPSGGTVTGQGEVPFSASGALAHFSGTLHSIRGSGRYAHASTRGISIRGTVQRTHNYAISVKITGTVVF